MTDRRFVPFGVCLLLFLLCVAPGAMAQISATASVESDYRYRGVSLSDGRPTLGLSLAYDHPSGVYAGGQAIAEDTAHDGVRMLGFVEYAGYAVRGPADLSFDLGVNNQTYEAYDSQGRSERYSEVYAGITHGDVSLHVYYSPNYVRPGWTTVYVDLSGAFHPVDRWRVYGHLGALQPITGPSTFYSRVDARIGVAREFRNFEIDLAATDISRATPSLSSAGRAAVTIGATYFF